MAPLFTRFRDENTRDDLINDDGDAHRQLRSSNSEQLAQLEEYLTHSIDRELESDSAELDSDHAYMAKRDALWTTTEVLDCVRRVKMYKNGSKLDRITEMLNCYRRLKHSG